MKKSIQPLTLHYNRKGNRNMKDSIVIFSATRARELLRAGFQIIDIKSDRKDKTHMRSVFVFRYDERIQQYLKENKIA